MNILTSVFLPATVKKKHAVHVAEDTIGDQRDLKQPDLFSSRPCVCIQIQVHA